MRLRSSLKQFVKPMLRRIVRVAVGPELDAIEYKMRLQAARLELQERYLKSHRSLQMRTSLEGKKESPIFRKDQTLEKSLETLRQLAPNVYAEWQAVSNAAEQAYRGFPTDSCSVEGHFVADLFFWFFEPLVRGKILDIGCGPQPVPRYLEGYPSELLFGIDPISSPKDHPFFFVQGVAEFLPWESKSFDIVVAAASLDHVLLLDRTFHEVHRVLKKDGHFVVWVSFLSGAEKYDPYDSDIRRTDQYHLFHFDKGWFEEAVSELFTIEEVYRCPTPDNSTFYNLRPV